MVVTLNVLKWQLKKKVTYVFGQLTNLSLASGQIACQFSDLGFELLLSKGRVMVTGAQLTTGHRPGAFNWANFGKLQPGTAIEVPNRAQLGVAGNQQWASCSRFCWGGLRPQTPPF